MASVSADPRASTREVVAFRLALALIVVAVLDDAFAHPEPGTALPGRLVSGLVPVAVAGVMFWAYPRLRPGARATLALVSGVLAVVAGIADGVRHVAIDRLSGDDFTVLVAGAAGVALVGIGLGRLWRSRRRDGHRFVRRTLIGLAAAVTTFLIVLPVCIAIIATHKARSPVAAAPGQAVSLRTDDGLRLAASYTPSRNRAAVIVFPGRSGTLRHARILARNGYGVLLLDRRGEGASEGTLNLFGWNGESDLRAALDFLGRRPDVDRVGGLGLSVGGELLLQTAADDARLSAVVSEGAGVRSLAEHLHTPGVGRLQRWGTNWVVQTAAVAVLSGTLPPGDLAERAARIAPRPVLLIRATEGNPDEVLNEVYAERVGRSAELWTVRSGHTGALAADPDGYERRVVAFFDRALRTQPGP